MASPEFRNIYEDDTVIPQDYDRYKNWPGPQVPEPAVSKDAVVFQGGAITQRNSGPYVMTFFIGTVAEYAKWRQEQDFR